MAERMRKLTAITVPALIFAVTGCNAPNANAAPPASTCGYWRDGSTLKGGALSAYPGKTPKDGTKATVQGKGAWKVCISVSDQTIWLKSAPGLFLQNVGGVAKWKNASGSLWQAWTFHERHTQQGGWRVNNRAIDTVDLCAAGGAGSEVDLTTWSTCGSKARETWGWTSQPDSPLMTGRRP